LICNRGKPDQQTVKSLEKVGGVSLGDDSYVGAVPNFGKRFLFGIVPIKQKKTLASRIGVTYI
jgi:hypothetical protein